MFIEKQPKEQIAYYERLLKAVGALSNLFSESPEPYLASRSTEYLFCKAFKATNLSRFDASADASKNKVGFGIKTFLNKNGKSMQKIAEFNGDHMLFESLLAGEKIKKISELRNERLETTKRIYGLDELIYHCITRKVGEILVYETLTPLINLKEIKDIKVKGNTIKFSDSSAEYSFNVSKSTLYKRFVTENILLKIPIRILPDPFTELEKLVSEAGPIFAPEKVLPHVFLPLYSVRGGTKNVPLKSGLNQWNTEPRLNSKKGTHKERNPDEVYVPIPAWIHKKFPNFFPPKDKTFELTLPDRNILSAKVCQDNSKALMTNPNSALGKWLLRDILNLKEKELLTYDKLQTIGLDSVVVYRVDNEHYDIDFTPIGSYENFLIESDENNDIDISPTEEEDGEIEESDS
jgi:hypothetical protein